MKDDIETAENKTKAIIDEHKKTLIKIGQTLEKLQKQLHMLSEETNDNHLWVSITLMIIHSTIGNMPIDDQITLLNDYIRLESIKTQHETPEEILKKFKELAKNEEEIKNLYI